MSSGVFSAFSDSRQAVIDPQHSLTEWLKGYGLNQNMLLYDEDLAKMLKQFEGTEYWDRALMNPYLQFTRQSGVADDLIGFFTSSPYQNAWNEQRQAAAEYFSKLQNNLSEQKYDSPIQQAARMRAAGQNPDLLGTSGVSESPTMDMPIVSPDISQGPGIVDFVNVITTAVTMAFAIAKDVKSLQAAGIANSGAEIKNANDMQSFVSGIAGMGSFDNNADVNPSSFNPFTSRKLRKSFEKSFSNTIHSFKSIKERNENFVGAEESAQKAAKHAASKFFVNFMNDPYQNADVFSGIQTISDVTTELLNKVDKQMAELNLKKIENQKTYEDNIDPALQAQTTNAQNKEAKEAVSMTNQMNAAMRELTNKLYLDYKKGNKFSGVLLMSLNMLRLMSVGVTSGKHSSVSFGI